MHSTIDNTAHFSPLNSLEHCICTHLDETHPTRPGFETSTVDLVTNDFASARLKKSLVAESRWS